MEENLKEWLGNKAFDEYQIGLSSRFSASGMEYNYSYNFDLIHSVNVFLSFENSETQINFYENGNLDFEYEENGNAKFESFINCKIDDFHTMIAHAFIYLRDKKFDYHKKWHQNLEKEYQSQNIPSDFPLVSS